MHHGPYTLIVCVDENNESHGTLYIDDEQSFNYRTGQYAYIQYQYKEGIVSSKIIKGNGYSTQSVVERIYLVGLNGKSINASLTSSEHTLRALEVQDGSNNAFIISVPDISVLEEWSIGIEISNGAEFLKGFLSIFGIFVILLQHFL